MNILLVAGHGAGDIGACSGIYKEADLTREVVVGVYEKLKDTYDVTVFDMNKNLCQYQKKNGSQNFSNYNLVLEIHFNAGGGTGCEMLIHKNTTQKGIDNNILLNLKEIGFKNRGIKTRTDLYNMNVCKKQHIPYSLLEVCFVDNKDDMKLYNNNKTKVAEKIANGIKEAYGTNVDKKELTEVNDIVWELAHRNIIANKDLWKNKLKQDINAYWLCRKTVQFLREHNL